MDSVRNCSICLTEPMCKFTFASHLLGKKHNRKARGRHISSPDEITKRSIQVRGLRNMNNYSENIITKFWDFEVINANFQNNVALLEFKTEEFAAKALKEEYLVDGTKLQLCLSNKSTFLVGKRVAQNNAQNKEELQSIPPLSLDVKKLIGEVSDWSSVHDTIDKLVKEIELKEMDYREREKIRFIMENFLRPIFPASKVYVFGSSANNLGFAGSDVDMVANLGFDLWDGTSREKTEKEAAELTQYLANEIKRRRRGYNVVAISRARVPIVKFTDTLNGLEVDLSFKNGMPLYNTSLIKLYTNTHPLVRPYMMVIRYWAKVQNLAGGSRPNTLVTNYCLCMMMVFWLMVRKRPVVPCVGELQDIYSYYKGQPVYINGWNCSFSDKIEKWKQTYHNANVLDLVAEFFEYYGSLDVKTWLISPLAGILVKKSDVKHHHPTSVQRYLEDFYKYKMTLPVLSPLCVQDPFEQCNNICKGLRSECVELFQFKCRKGAAICKLIKDMKAPLGRLFTDHSKESELIDLTLSPNVSRSMPVDDDVPEREKGEENDCDILSVTSDESIELEQELESLRRDGEMNLLKEGGESSVDISTRPNLNKFKDKTIVMESIVEEMEDDIQIVGHKDNDVEVIEEVVQVKDHDESSEEALLLKEVGVVLHDDTSKAKETKDEDESANTEVLLVDIEDEQTNSPDGETNEDVDDKNMFTLNISNRDFEFSPDGLLDIKKRVLANPTEQNACVKDFFVFLLKHSLRCEIVESHSPEINIENELLAIKRKTYESQKNSPQKFIKLNDGEGKSSEKILIQLSKYRCKTKGKVWEGRGKDNCTKPLRYFEMNHLERTVAVTNIIADTYGHTHPSLEFEATLLKDGKCKNTFLISCKCISENLKEKKLFGPFFKFFTRNAKEFSYQSQDLIKRFS